MRYIRRKFMDETGRKTMYDECLKDSKAILKKYLEIITAFFYSHTDDKEAVILMHLMSKMGIALESCHALLDLGYFGSANTVYRQIYEYVLWAKMYISVDKTESLSVSNVFLENNLKNGKPYNADNYIKKFDIEIPDENKKSLSEEDKDELTREYYTELCALTHGSKSSQQVFLPPYDNYVQASESLVRFTTMLNMVMYVSYLAFIQLGIWDSNDILSEKYSIKTHELFENCRNVLKKISPESEGQYTWQVVVLKGKWSYKK